MRDKRTIKTWSSTQDVTFLSSGEAEDYGITKASACDPCAVTSKSSRN